MSLPKPRAVRPSARRRAAPRSRSASTARRPGLGWTEQAAARARSWSTTASASSLSRWATGGSSGERRPVWQWNRASVDRAKELSVPEAASLNPCAWAQALTTRTSDRNRGCMSPSRPKQVLLKTPSEATLMSTRSPVTISTLSTGTRALGMSWVAATWEWAPRWECSSWRSTLAFRLACSSSCCSPPRASRPAQKSVPWGSCSVTSRSLSRRQKPETWEPNRATDRRPLKRRSTLVVNTLIVSDRRACSTEPGVKRARSLANGASSVRQGNQRPALQVAACAADTLDASSSTRGRFHVAGTLLLPVAAASPSRSSGRRTTSSTSRSSRASSNASSRLAASPSSHVSMATPTASLCWRRAFRVPRWPARA